MWISQSLFLRLSYYDSFNITSLNDYTNIIDSDSFFIYRSVKKKKCSTYKNYASCKKDIYRFKKNVHRITSVLIIIGNIFI